MIEQIGDVEAHLEGWEQLAAASARPYAMPGWSLAWWRHAAPTSARLRLVLVHEGRTLVGVAPLYAERFGRGWQYRHLASPVCQRVTPLARAGDERRVAHVVAHVLARTDPVPTLLRFEGCEADSPWPEAIAEGWPGRRPATVELGSGAAPNLPIEGLSLEEWWAGKSSNFRSGMGRDRRSLARQGATSRLCPPADVGVALADFTRLHRARWDDRGGSATLGDGVEEMLADAAAALAPGGMLRLFEIRIGDRAISSHLFLAAGGEVSYWLGGFDDAFGKYHPALLGVLDAIEDAIGRGETRVDLGNGDQPYKQRFATEAEALRWVAIVPSRQGAVVVRARLAAERARPRITARIPVRVKRLLRGSPAPGGGGG